MSDSGFVLEIPGQPVPSGRPRFARIGQGVRTFPAKTDGPAKDRVHAAWVEAGCPRVSGPYSVEILAAFPRPKSHLKKDGEMSATGRRAGPPRGDCDNLGKLPVDLLVEVGATPDDRYCVELSVRKWWTVGEGGVTVTVAPA